MLNKLNIALQHHLAGQLQQAETLYHEVLRDEPRNPDALHLLGMAAHRLGRSDEAIQRIREAISACPDFAEYHNNLASVLLDQGSFEAGAASCREALRLDPRLSQAHSNLGNALQGLNHLDEALACYGRALQLDPQYAQAHANLGGLLFRLGRYDEALASCQSALALQPNLPEALNNLGDAYRALGQPQEAIRYYERALVVRPSSATIYNSLGNALREVDQLDAAWACFQRAIELQPSYAPAHISLAIVLRMMNRFDEAAASYQQALQLNPEDAEVQNNLGEILWRRQQPSEAMDRFKQAIALVPSLPTAHYNFANVLRGQGALEEAVASYRKAVSLDPGFAAAWNNLAMTLSEQGKSMAALECFRQTLEIAPEDARAHSHVLVCQQYLPGVSLTGLAEAHAHWNDRHAVPLKSTWKPHPNAPDPDRPLRIGFISRDFRRHPVGYFLSRVLNSLDGSRYVTTCYYDHLDEDSITQSLRAASSHWRNVHGKSDEQLAAQVREDSIDILLELAGHTAGNRLLAIARRPAPVQVTWMGYVGTTGLEAVDYLISDRFHTPAGVEPRYREAIVRLPDGYVCYDPPDYAPEVGPLPATNTGCISFGSFNNPAKFSATTVELWSRILNRVPRSRLVLKYSGLDDPGSHRHFHEAFAATGIDSARIVLLGPASHQELLESYNQIDIALDSVPYSGGLTTCEALWMGVPVIACPGETFASRHAFSHLANAGVGETIAENFEEYVEKGVQLAQHLDELSRLRSRLRERVAASPLCDGSRFARGFEAALRQMWHRWCATK